MTADPTSVLTVPEIDIERWRTGDAAARADIQQQVDTALATTGFLVITNHGVPDQLVSDVRDTSAEVFALPTETKATYRQSAGIGGPGWCPIGAEANAYASGEETPPDLKEAWSIAPIGEGAMVPTSRGIKPSHNLFPAEVPAFEGAVRGYLDAGMALAQDLFELLALAAEVPADTFAKLCSSPLHTMNLTLYPPLVNGDDVIEPKPNQYRIGPHCDFGTITILHREPSDPPLEVQTLDGSWIAVPDVPGAFVVNVGDQLAYWSGGRWRSNPHRILAPVGDSARESKLSLVLFIETDVGAMLQPIGQPDAEPMDAVQFIVDKLAAIDMAI